MITSKQRAYLRSLANSIDTIIMIGKSDIGPEVIKQAEDAIKAREIIKGKVLETSSLTVRDVANFIADKINAEVVQVIGFKFVLYKRNDDKPKIQLPR